MQELISAFSRRALAELIEATPRASGLRSWIQDGSFYVDTSSSSNRIILKNISVSEFVSFQGFDFSRFALASLETMANCSADPNYPRAISWPLLKAYYAGFFGGHAILRALGQSILRLEPIQSKKLSDIGKLYCGDDFVVTAGTFDVRIAQNDDRSVDVSLTRMDESGGAHSVFWKRFYAFLNETIEDVVLTGGVSSASVIAKLQELQSILSSRGSLGSGTWLSTIRNLINYQHQLGVWFPFGATESDVRHAANIGYLDVGTARMDYDAKKDQIKSFCTGSLFIAALSSDLSTRLIDQTTKRNAPFVRHWRRLEADVAASQ